MSQKSHSLWGSQSPICEIEVVLAIPPRDVVRVSEVGWKIERPGDLRHYSVSCHEGHRPSEPSRPLKSGLPPAGQRCWNRPGPREVADETDTWGQTDTDELSKPHV